jgi:DNA-binding GntR family transcriptional regulator
VHRPQISRTPLREALKVLAAEGLVLLLLPNRGSRAAKLTSKDVQHCSRFARALKAWPASSPANAAISKMHIAMAQHYHDRDLQLYYLCNRQIHEAIVDAARNPVLSALTSR